MVAQIADIQVTLTRTEGEALLLENDLIKAHRPRFNVLLRDDKSYPFIYLTSHERFRGCLLSRPAAGPGRYFGPYPSAWAVRETLQLLQKLFPVRQCEDGFYRNRTRPCLQYQIKRCTGPLRRLRRPDRTMPRTWSAASSSWRGAPTRSSPSWAAHGAGRRPEFERAATLRDQIATLRASSSASTSPPSGGDLDIVACGGGGAELRAGLLHPRRAQPGQQGLFPADPPGCLGPGGRARRPFWPSSTPTRRCRRRS
jgi:excinuclease ABC subunit C